MQLLLLIRWQLCLRLLVLQLQLGLFGHLLFPQLVEERQGLIDRFLTGATGEDQQRQHKGQQAGQDAVFGCGAGSLVGHTQSLQEDELAPVCNVFNPLASCSISRRHWIQAAEGSCSATCQRVGS